MGSPSQQKRCVRTSLSHHFCRLFSAVRLRRVKPGCYSSTHLPGRVPPEVFRAARKQPSRLLAQRVRDALPQTRQAILTATPRPGFPQPPASPATGPRTPTPTAPGDTVSARPSARIVFPSFRPCYGPSRPRPRRESVHPTDCRSLPGAGSLRSPIPCTVKARQSHATRHPPGSSGRQAASHWWLGDSASHKPDTPETPNHQRLLS